MPVITQLMIPLENKPGALAQLCSAMAERAVNILGLKLGDSPSGGSVRLVVSHLEAARLVCQQLKLQFGEERALAVHCGNRPGALGRVTRKLAEAGINIEYAYGTIEKSSERAMIVLGVSDLDKAAKLVR